MRRETLLPLQRATILDDEEDDGEDGTARTAMPARVRWSSTSPSPRRS